MALKIGDKVRTYRGLEGEIVLLNGDGYSAMVRLPDVGRGVVIVSLPLSVLTSIAAYSSAPPVPRYRTA